MTLLATGKDNTTKGDKKTKFIETFCMAGPVIQKAVTTVSMQVILAYRFNSVGYLSLSNSFRGVSSNVSPKVPA